MLDLDFLSFSFGALADAEDSDSEDGSGGSGRETRDLDVRRVIRRAANFRTLQVRFCSCKGEMSFAIF